MENLFYNRNKKISNLNLLADSLGRSLRENITLFSVDDSDSKAVFVSESGFIIEGTYYLGENVILDNITVESGDVFVDEEKFDSSMKNQISLFIESVYSDELVGAGDVFDSIIDSWGQRVKFNETVERLEEQTESFNNTFNIVDTKEFVRFMEVSENISKFLGENVEKISKIPEVVNAIKLSNTVSKAFNIPRLTMEELQEKGSFETSLVESSDIYEMVCKQELVKKEILESKKSFDTVWITEPCISKLASNIFEDDDEVIARSLVEAFVEIPYISLISKKQLSSTIQKNLSVIEESRVYTKNELKEFVGKLFEMKKPLKGLVSNLLQEKYGVNVNNLKESPTFKTLLNTQVIIFESLSKLCPRGSVIKESLADVSEMLKGKNGVQALDINEGIKYLFTNSGYANLYEEAEISSNFQLKEKLVEDTEMVDLILGELLIENKKKPAKVQESVAVEEPSEDVTEEAPEEEVEDVEIGYTSRELLKKLSEIEALIDNPDMEDE